MARIRGSKNRRVMRHKRVRRKVFGTIDRPRLAVYRSLNHIYAQVINDVEGNTLAAASSMEPAVREQKDGKKKAEISKIVGELIAERAKEKGISAVVFDRGGNQYHGRIHAIASTAREGGLVF